MELSQRLYTVFSMLPEGCTPLDVGTDHCYLPVFALQQGKIRRAFASDVRPGPLDAARRNAERYGYGNDISLYLSDGLDALPETVLRQTDAVIIAGMGGLLIADIIHRAPFLKERRIPLLLQPMTAVFELKDDLRAGGFVTEAERIAREGDKLYIVIRAVYDPTAEIPENPYVSLVNDPLFDDWIADRRARFEKQRAGLLSAAEPDRARLAEAERRLAQIDEILAQTARTSERKPTI